MLWYQYIAAFFAGAFLCNAVPHFVQGISGNKFPTPFAKPPGKGLSSAVVNTVWGLLNILIGSLLLCPGQVSQGNCTAWVLFGIGVAAMAIMLSVNFQKKDKE